MPPVCVSLTNNPTIIAFLTPVQAAMVNFALEFATNCSVAATLGNLLGDDSKEEIESALKEAMNAASTIYKAVQNAVSTYNAILQEGLDLLMAALDVAWGIVSNAMTIMLNVMNQLIGMLANAINAAVSSACNALNEALTGMPSDVKIQNAGLAAATAIQASGKPAEFAQKMLKSLGIDSAKQSIFNARSALSSVQGLPNLSGYICTP